MSLKISLYAWLLFAIGCSLIGVSHSIPLSKRSELPNESQNSSITPTPLIDATYVVTPITDVIANNSYQPVSQTPVKVNKGVPRSHVKSSRFKLSKAPRTRAESVLIYDQVHLVGNNPNETTNVSKSLRFSFRAFNRNHSISIWPMWEINKGQGFSEVKRYMLTPHLPSNMLREVAFHKSNQLSRENVTNLYVNIANSSALLVTHFYRNNHKEVELFGIVSERLLIVPAWHHLAPRIPGANNSERGSLHVLVENGEKISPINVEDLLMKIKATVPSRMTTDNVPNPGLPLPQVILPEITLVIDYYTYRLHGSNIEQIWRYFVIFFSRLELIYRQVNLPKIELKLKNIYIVEKPLDFQLDRPKGLGEKGTLGGYINALKAIHEFGFFVYDHQPIFYDSDIVLVVTGQDLCLDDNQKNYDSCNQFSIKGQTFVGGVCQHDPTSKRMNVAVIEDRGLFDGVRVAAHELGHLLGSVHDGQWPLAGILGPGGRGCAPDGGYLMSKQGQKRTRTGVSSKVEWSVCSVEQFQYFLKHKNGVCLYNRSNDFEI